MIEHVTFSTFYDHFMALRPKHFSDDGLRALYEYLEDFEDSTGEQIEFDVIALCCDFVEYTDLYEYATDHDFDAPDEDEEVEDYEERIRDYLYDNGTFLEFDGGIIVSQQ